MKLPQHFSTKSTKVISKPATVEVFSLSAPSEGGERADASQSAFTMVEIAISLAVIAFALVAIIGVLPMGMNVQKDNREQTIINFDANYLMNALRNGALGQDNLTNFVYSISITSSNYNSNGVQGDAPPPYHGQYSPPRTVSLTGGRSHRAY